MPDDAAVVRLDDERALVLTTDFFTPIVDDPYLFGRIAAVNALSDVYAMGGEPFAALNLLSIPQGKLPDELVAAILRGGYDAAAEAHCMVLGGHTVDDPEPKYGLAVVGLVHPDRVLTNATARPGDVLVLTKPLGTGLIATAIKAESAQPQQIDALVQSACLLNEQGMRAAIAADVHSLTDVTGFGLLGHLWEMCNASGVAAQIDLASLPQMPGVLELIREGLIPGGTHANLKYVEPGLIRLPGADPDLLMLAADAQTSGGLLAALPPGNAEKMLEGLAQGPFPGWVVGKIIDGEPGAISVK